MTRLSSQGNNVAATSPSPTSHLGHKTSPSVDAAAHSDDTRTSDTSSILDGGSPSTRRWIAGDPDLYFVNVRRSSSATANANAGVTVFNNNNCNSNDQNTGNNCNNVNNVNNSANAITNIDNEPDSSGVNGSGNSIDGGNESSESTPSTTIERINSSSEGLSATAASSGRY